LNSVWFAKMKNTVKIYSFSEENKNEITKYILSTGFAGILCNVKEVYSKYLEKMFLSKWFNDLKDKSTHGSTQQAINNQEIKDFEIPLPSLPEQKKIVYVLDAIQETIKVQEKIIEKTKEIKRSLLNEIFNAKTKNKKSKLQFKIKKWVKLKEMADIIMGQSPSSKFYNIVENGLPFLQGKAEFRETSPQPLKWCSQPIKITEKGDVLISVRAPVGDTNLADQSYCIGRGLAAIRSKPNLDNFYLFNYLQRVKEQISNLGSGSTFKSINKETLENFEIPFLSLSEQCEIAEILQTVDQKIEIEQKKKMLYEELFKTMLKKLMNREIRTDNLKI